MKAIEKGYEDKLLISFDTFWSVMRGERDYTEQDPEIATRMPIDFLNKNYFPKIICPLTRLPYDLRHPKKIRLSSHTIFKLKKLAPKIYTDSSGTLVSF